MLVHPFCPNTVVQAYFPAQLHCSAAGEKYPEHYYGHSLPFLRSTANFKLNNKESQVNYRTIVEFSLPQVIRIAISLSYWAKTGGFGFYADICHNILCKRELGLNGVV
jgi:hypothetical protein